MCSYNRINGSFGCGNDWLLNQVLKRDWGYKGFVMSDWGAVHQLDFALAGLDQQSGQQIDLAVHFDKPIAAAAAQDPRYAARVDDMNRRILRSIYAVGLDSHPPKRRKVDAKANADVAEQVARQGSVLLRNSGALLPLPANLKRIAVIGGNADAGVLAGGGSSLVHGPDGPAALRTIGPEGPFSKMMNETYHDSVPLKALRARVPATRLSYRTGRYISDAVSAARQADVAIVFATQYMSEGYDVPDLSLPEGQDALIAAVAAANPRTVVVLQTGGPVLMPWLGAVGAVLQAWYPGARGAEAITALLFGDENPSGRLPISFPASESQLPRPALDGADTVEPGFVGRGAPGQTLTVNYDIEGSDVGYRWHARKGQQPLFALGYGLSYTRFETRCSNAVATPAPQLTCSVRNVGDRAGAEVVQVYLTSMAGTATRRLAGYQRVMLAAGESRDVTVTLEPRVLAQWRDGQWQQSAGHYLLATGRSSLDLDPPVTLTLPARNWK
jgi:beta-glucosidase